MQVPYMRCGGGKGAAIIVPVSAGASHSVPVKSTWLMQSGAEQSCQMTVNLQWKISVDKNQASDNSESAGYAVLLHCGELGSV